MAQINSNWTAPTFSFDSADQPTAWRDFYYRATDYLESLRINPKEEDQQKKGWTQIKLMFKGEDRHALQTLIDNDTITEADQHTPTPYTHTESYTNSPERRRTLLALPR